MTKTIAVLLTVFNRKNTTLRCLCSLFSQALPEDCHFDVFLTDDGCTDGTAKAVADRFPSVRIISSNGELYWNRGMWTAWNEASHAVNAEGNVGYDYYLWLNDDTVLYPNAVSGLLESAVAHSSQAIIVGACIASDDSQTVTYGGRRNSSLVIPDGVDAAVDYFNGNIVLVPRYVFERLGNLDYYFRHSKGDFDYGLRAKQARIEVFQCGKVIGICDEHPTIDGWCNPSVPLKKRLTLLRKPTGMPPKEVFHLERRHKGLFVALFHSVTVVIRCIFPQIWVRG